MFATGAVLALGSAAAFVPPASAQTVEEVTVVGKPKALPETLSYRVSYADLDLATPDGQKELDRRIRVAAEYVCGVLNSGTDVGTCVTDARRNASRQEGKAKSSQPHPFQAGPTWVAPPGKK
jgi:UrcA family protein